MADIPQLDHVTFAMNTSRIEQDTNPLLDFGQRARRDMAVRSNEALLRNRPDVFAFDEAWLRESAFGRMQRNVNRLILILRGNWDHDDQVRRPEVESIG